VRRMHNAEHAEGGKAPVVELDLRPAVARLDLRPAVATPDGGGRVACCLRFNAARGLVVAETY
jgi:hypothetical protein